jgi:hypothetical protein
MPGVISAAIDGKLVGQAKLDGRDAGLVSVSGPYGSKVVWSNNLNSQTFVTILDGTGEYGAGHYVVFKIVQNETGGCGRYFGSTAGSFSSTQDECRMKQEEIDSTCKNYSGQDYKINWTRFNPDNTVKEVISLQSGTCLKLPQQPPTYVDNPTQPPSQPPEAACGSPETIADGAKTYAFAYGEELALLNSFSSRFGIYPGQGNAHADQATADKVCNLKGFSRAASFASAPWYSCMDNVVVRWDGYKFTMMRACTSNRKLEKTVCQGLLIDRCSKDLTWVSPQFN